MIIAAGGWALVREDILSMLDATDSKPFVDTAILLNLFDNYIINALMVYPVFKTGRLDLYMLLMKRILIQVLNRHFNLNSHSWTLDLLIRILNKYEQYVLCFNRKNYKFAIAEFLSQFSYWEENFPELAEVFKDPDIRRMIDEYAIEHLNGKVCNTN